MEGRVKNVFAVRGKLKELFYLVEELFIVLNAKNEK